MSPKSSTLCLLEGDQVQVFLGLSTNVVTPTDLLAVTSCRALPNRSYSQINISKTCLSEKILILEVEISSVEGVNYTFKNTLYF